jgi:hypothetical protein
MTDNENGAAIKTYSFSTDSFDAIERLLVEHSGDNTIMSVKDLLVLVRRAKRLAMQAFDSESALSKVRDELASVQVRLRAAEAETSNHQDTIALIRTLVRGSNIEVSDDDNAAYGVSVMSCLYDEAEKENKSLVSQLATANERIDRLTEAITAVRDEAVKNREQYRRNAFTAGGAGMPDNEGYWQGKSDESGKISDKLTAVLSAPLTGTEKATIAPPVAGDGGEANDGK